MTTGGQDDLVALERDAALFDALAARAPTPGDDPAVRLLAALAAEADDPMPAGADRRPRAVAAGVRARRLGARGAVAFGVAVSVMSATGVAAAVAGSPLTRLTPLEAVVRSVQGEKAAPSAQEPQPDAAAPGDGPLVPGAETQRRLKVLPDPSSSGAQPETAPTPIPTPTAEPDPTTDPLPTTTTDPAVDPSTTTYEEPSPTTTTDETATPEPTATFYPGKGRSQAQPNRGQGAANGLSGR